MPARTIQTGRFRHASREAMPAEGSIAIPFLGVANDMTWEEHMEWATRGLPEAEKAAIWEEYGARHAEQEARDVTPL